MIYVRNYTQGEDVAEKIDCLFYKAIATNKQELFKK
jgi:hypothetical protein